MLRESKLFGNATRTEILVAIRMLRETYPSELARLLERRLYSVQSVLTALELESVIASRRLGRNRAISLDPRYFAHRELSSLLWKLGEQAPTLQRKLAQVRRRPRRAGKPGL